MLNSNFRYGLIFILVLPLAKCEVLAQNYPTPTAKQKTLWVCENTSCITGHFDTHDLDGHVIGKITNLKLVLVQDRISISQNRVRWILNYDYYNGSGTWTQGGVQDLSIYFQTSAGEQKDYYLVHPIDRGHCVYGGTEHRYSNGFFATDHYDAIIGANIIIPAIQSFQNPC